MKMRLRFKLVLVICMLPMVGCSDGLSNPTTLDQCLRREIFKECLAAVPKGPTTTGMSSDWDEVVDSCGSQAQYQAYRKLDQIKSECRP